MHRTLGALSIMMTLTGCFDMETPGMVRLAGQDPRTADLAALRVAVALPSYLRIVEGTAVMNLGAKRTDGAEFETVLDLVPASAEDAPVAGAGRSIAVRRVAPEQIDDLAAARDRILDWNERYPGQGEMTFNINASLCRTTPLPDTAIPVSGWIRLASDEPYLFTMQVEDIVPFFDNLFETHGGEIKPCEA